MSLFQSEKNRCERAPVYKVISGHDNEGQQHYDAGGC